MYALKYGQASTHVHLSSHLHLQFQEKINPFADQLARTRYGSYIVVQRLHNLSLSFQDILSCERVARKLSIYLSDIRSTYTHLMEIAERYGGTPGRIVAKIYRDSYGR